MTCIGLSDFLLQPCALFPICAAATACCLVWWSSRGMSALQKNVLTAARLCAYLFRHPRTSCANLQKSANPNIYIDTHPNKLVCLFSIQFDCAKVVDWDVWWGAGGILHKMTWTLPQFSHRCTAAKTVAGRTMTMLLLMSSVRGGGGCTMRN